MATKQKRIYKCVLKYPFCCICSLLHPEIFLFLLFLFLHTVASTTFLMQHYITQYNSACAFPDPIVLLQSWIWKHFNTKLLVLGVCQWIMELWFIWLVDIEFLPANVLWSKIQLYQSNSNWRNKVSICHFLQIFLCFWTQKCLCVLQLCKLPLEIGWPGSELGCPLSASFGSLLPVQGSGSETWGWWGQPW